MSAAVIALAAALLLGLVGFALHVLRGARRDVEGEPLLRWATDDLGGRPSKSEKRRMHAYLEQARGRAYIPVRRHQRRRA